MAFINKSDCIFKNADVGDCGNKLDLGFICNRHLARFFHLDLYSATIVTGSGSRRITYLCHHDLKQSYIPFPIEVMNADHNTINEYRDKSQNNVTPDEFEICISNSAFDNVLRYHISQLNIRPEEEATVLYTLATLIAGDTVSSLCHSLQYNTKAQSAINSWQKWLTFNKELVVKQSGDKKIHVLVPRNNERGELVDYVVPIQVKRLPIVMQHLINAGLISETQGNDNMQFPFTMILPTMVFREKRTSIAINDGKAGNFNDFFRIRLSKQGGQDPNYVVYSGTQNAPGGLEFFSTIAEPIMLISKHSGSIGTCP